MKCVTFSRLLKLYVSSYYCSTQYIKKMIIFLFILNLIVQTGRWKLDPTLILKERTGRYSLSTDGK
jgi:hypothetical protein